MNGRGVCGIGLRVSVSVRVGGGGVLVFEGVLRSWVVCSVGGRRMRDGGWRRLKERVVMRDWEKFGEGVL